DAGSGVHSQPAQGVVGRLQGAEAHRNPAEPAARGFRKDLQAPLARSVLGAGGPEDLAARRPYLIPHGEERVSASRTMRPRSLAAILRDAASRLLRMRTTRVIGPAS